MEGQQINRPVLIFFLDSGYKLVSCRTAGAAFGSKEFDDGKAWVAGILDFPAAGRRNGSTWP